MFKALCSEVIFEQRIDKNSTITNNVCKYSSRKKSRNLNLDGHHMTIIAKLSVFLLFNYLTKALHITANIYLCHLKVKWENNQHFSFINETQKISNPAFIG